MLLADLAAAFVTLDPLIDPDRVALCKEHLVRNYRNYSLERADTHAVFAARLFLEEGRWDIASKLAAAEAATPASLAE